MAIVEMKKATIYGLRREQDAVVRALMDAGCLQMSEFSRQTCEEESLSITDLSEMLTTLEQDMQALLFALKFILPYDKKKMALLTQRREVAIEELDRIKLRRSEVLLSAYWARRLDVAKAELKNRQIRLQARIEQLEPWQSLDVPVEMLHDTATTSILAGTVPTLRLEELMGRLSTELPGCAIEKICQSKETTFLFLACHWRDAELFRTILKDCEVNRTSFEGTGTPAYILEGMHAKLDSMTDTRVRLEDESKGLVCFKEDMEALYDALQLEQNKLVAASRIAATQQAFVLTGWVPAFAEKHLREALGRTTKACEIILEVPGDEDTPPTLLENSKLVAPYEAITNLYSIPDYHGIDPNKIMAPFYFMFFGMMVSDAGYGVVLALLLYSVLAILKPRGTLKSLISLLAMGGISTVLWGILYGGWFGISVKPLWFNPMEEPIYTLLVCFALGAVQILVGLGIKAYMNFKRGNPWDAVWDQFTWMLLITSMPMLALPGLAMVGTVLSLGSVLAILLMAGRAKKNFFSRLISGAGALYGITGYFSDILSYSRLFALGLATGVIANVINLIAVMLGGSAIGKVAMVLVLIGGHTFNIGINVLGAYVHSSRLQYIEFFGKFYEGGGKPFNPLARITRYVDIAK